jgi:hypothetical protein
MELNRAEERKVEEFILRCQMSRETKRVDNSSLPAGAPMVYYCHACGAHTVTLPELHFSRPPRYCDACEDLRKEGLLDEAKRRVA